MPVSTHPRNMPAARTVAQRRAGGPRPLVGKPITRVPQLPAVRPGNMLGIPERLPGAIQLGGPAAPAPSGVAATTPANPNLIASGVGGALTGPKLDSSYFAGVAGVQFKNKNDIADLKLQQGYADTDYNTTLRRLAEQQAQATQNTREGMNRKGLFYSGQLGKAQGVLDKGYEDQRYDIGKNYSRGSDARTEAIRRIQAGEPLEIAQLRGENDQRILANATPPKAPDPNTPNPHLIAPGIGGALMGKHGGPPKVSFDQKLGGEWHTYPDGRKVFVKKKK